MADQTASHRYAVIAPPSVLRMIVLAVVAMVTAAALSE